MNRDTEYYQSLRDVLIETREACNMTQQQFADALGISRSSLAMMETGQRRVSKDVINALLESQLDIDKETREKVVIASELKDIIPEWVKIETKLARLDEFLGKRVFGPISQTGVNMRFGDREFTLSSTPEVLEGIAFRRNLAIQKLDIGDWVGVEEIVNSLYDDMQSSLNLECQTAVVKALLIILGVAESLNCEEFDNIFSDEKQFELMKCFGDIRVSELNLSKVKSFSGNLLMEDMKYYSSPDIPAVDLDSRKRQVPSDLSNSQGNYLIDFQAIGERPRIDIVNHWIDRLVEGERIEKTEIAHILHCLYYLFPQRHQKKVANTLLDNLFENLNSSNTECALWERWQSVRSLEPLVPLFDHQMKARLERVRDEYPSRVIQVGAEMVLAEKITKVFLEKVSRIVVEEVCSSERHDVKTCHVYIYAGYEFFNFIQRFLSESEELLSFEGIQRIIEEILYCNWLPPKVSVPMIISSIHHRLNDADKLSALKCLVDFLDETKQYDEVKEIRQARSLAKATMQEKIDGALN